MPIKPSSAKNKGRRFQQWVRDMILSTFPVLEPGDVRSTSMGAMGVDILLSPAAERLFPFAVECKNNKSNSIYALYDQAVANRGKMEPILFVKADRRKPLVVLDAEFFFEWLKK